MMMSSLRALFVVLLLAWYPVLLVLLPVAAEAADSEELQHFPLISHEQQTRRLAAKSGQQNGVEDAPLFQGIGTHFVDLFIGTPIPQVQTLIVDTGSDWTAFPCQQDCCGKHLNAPFQREKSDTYKAADCGGDIPTDLSQAFDPETAGGCSSRSQCDIEQNVCDISMRYMEGSSWTAVEGRDQVAFSQNGNKYELKFGCQTETTKLFLTQMADGMLGMSDAPLSLWRQAGVESFSLCFTSSEVGGAQAGVFTLGGTDDRLLLPHHKMRHAKRAQNFFKDSYYFVSLTGFFFKQYSEDNHNHLQHHHHSHQHHHHGHHNNKTSTSSGSSSGGGGRQLLRSRQRQLSSTKKAKMIPVTSGLALVDSGTTSTYLIESLSKPFRQAFIEASGGHNWDSYLRLTQQEVEALPDLVLRLEPATANHSPVDVHMSPFHYLELKRGNGKKGEQQQMYGPGIFFEGYDQSTLGANFLRGHNVHFAPDKIGFGESKCDYGDIQQVQQQQQKEQQKNDDSDE